MKRNVVAGIVLLLLQSGCAASRAARSPSSVARFDIRSGISVEAHVSQFDAHEHAIARCHVYDNWSGVCLIDGKPVFGTDWDLPVTMLDSATLLLGDQAIPLDVSGMYNPWVGEPLKDAFRVEEVEGGYEVTGNFSDGAGSYRARWWVVDGISIRTLIEGAAC